MKKKVCEVHGTDLLAETAEIIYGLPDPPIGYPDEMKRFPNANTEVLGGCCIEIGDDGKWLSPTDETVLYCPDCRHAQEEFQNRSA